MKSALLPQAERRVGRLRVRAAEEGEARHFSILLADALRTASLPIAEQGQMLVVRRLSLGRVSPFASAATLALQLELAMRAARLSAVHFASPAAGSANAVVFPSRAEALAALARAHARRIEPGEWFWRAAVGGWASPLSRSERWRVLLEAAHELPEAVVAAARIVHEALRAGDEDELLSALPPGQGAEWLERAGWSWSGAERAMNEVETRGRASNLPASPNHRDVIDRWERRWGPISERLVWLATVLAVAENPARAADPGLVAAITQRLALSRAKIGAPKRHACQSGVADSSAIASAKKDNRIFAREKRVSTRSRAETAPAGERVSDAMEAAESSIEMVRAEKELTAFGGLLFLVPVLERLGFSEFLAANPGLLESEFPSRLFRFVGARVGMLADDPLALALVPAQPIQSEPGWLPAQLPRATRKILAFPAPRARLDSPLMAWTTALRRWSRRHARLGLISLICRPGRVAISPTQLDIFFDLARADLRLRRVALDVDPGWVPWLGRVVRFHYLAAHDQGL